MRLKIVVNSLIVGVLSTVLAFAMFGIMFVIGLAGGMAGGRGSHVDTSFYAIVFVLAGLLALVSSGCFLYGLFARTRPGELTIGEIFARIRGLRRGQVVRFGLVVAVVAGLFVVFVNLEPRASSVPDDSDDEIEDPVSAAPPAHIVAELSSGQPEALAALRVPEFSESAPEHDNIVIHPLRLHDHRETWLQISGPVRLLYNDVTPDRPRNKLAGAPASTAPPAVMTLGSDTGKIAVNPRGEIKIDYPLSVRMADGRSLRLDDVEVPVRLCADRECRQPLLNETILFSTCVDPDDDHVFVGETVWIEYRQGVANKLASRYCGRQLEYLSRSKIIEKMGDELYSFEAIPAPDGSWFKNPTRSSSCSHIVRGKKQEFSLRAPVGSGAIEATLRVEQRRGETCEIEIVDFSVANEICSFPFDHGGFHFLRAGFDDGKLAYVRGRSYYAYYAEGKPFEYEFSRDGSVVYRWHKIAAHEWPKLMPGATQEGLRRFRCLAEVANQAYRSVEAGREGRVY